MARWVVHHLDKPDSGDIRAATRPAHLDYLEQFDIEIGGPLLDGDGNMCGSLIVVDLPDLESAQQFAADDPYNQAGLFAHSSVHGINTVTWPA